MSYPLIESLPYTKKQQRFQNEIHPMAEQVVTVDKSYGYDALTHANKHSNDSGYFTIRSGYGNFDKKIGYDKGCEEGHVKRDILGRVTIVDYATMNSTLDCGCTQYKKRNCTGTMGELKCSDSTYPAMSCPKNNPVCCHPGDMCAPRMIGDSGTCIAGQPYPYGGKVGP